MASVNIAKMNIDKEGSKEAVMKFFGALKNKDVNWKDKDEKMRAFRKEFDDRF